MLLLQTIAVEDGIGTVIEIVSAEVTMLVAAIPDEKIDVIVLEKLIANVVVEATLVVLAVAAAVVEVEVVVPIATTRIEIVRAFAGFQVLVKR